MLGAVCKEVNNWFEQSKQFGGFSIVDGTLTVEGAQDGQYVRIVGSVFNDGVYQYPMNDMTDETFDGAVWLMAVPSGFLDLVEEICAWQHDNGDALSSPYTSESFGGYSYTRKVSSDGSEYSWRDAFASKLNRWRKI